MMVRDHLLDMNIRKGLNIDTTEKDTYTKVSMY